MTCIVNVLSRFNEAIVEINQFFSELSIKNNDEFIIESLNTYDYSATMCLSFCYFGGYHWFSPKCDSRMPECSVIYDNSQLIDINENYYQYMMIFNPEIIICLNKLGIDLASEKFLIDNLGVDYQNNFTFITATELKLFPIPKNNIPDGCVIGFFTKPNTYKHNTIENMMNHIMFAFSYWLQEVILKNIKDQQFIIKYENSISNMMIETKTMYLNLYDIKEYNVFFDIWD